MKIARPIAFLFIMTLVFALLHASSFEVFAQTECVQPLDSVAVEGTWNDDCLSLNREDAYARYYTFSILRQFDVSITLESETDPYVFLLSGTGADADYLAENDDIDTGGRNFNSRVAITLEPGDYTIEATTYEQPAVGDFTLTVRGVGPLDDRAALAVLYNATDGPNWSDNTNWLTDVPLGEWQGVTTNDDGRVTELVFEGINLSGQIPSEIGNLSELEKLIFLDNELTGEIPTELGKLTRLKLLDLGRNEFTGSIPIDLSSLTKLQRLWLDNNRLTDTIPPELGDLPSLEEIYLSGNQLTGCVPESLEDALEDFDELGLPLCNDADTTPTLPACVEALPETTTVAGTWNTDCTSNISAPQGRGDRYARFYAFTLNEAATVTVTLESSADTYLYLRKGLGRDETELLCENDDYSTPVNGTSCSNIDFNLNAQYDSGILASLGAGTYTIESTTYTAGTTGDFTLTTAGIDFTKPDASDRAALTALYNATNGDNWTHSDNWLTDALLSEWHGVYTNEDGRVTELDLNFNNLTGTLSPELVNLSELQALNLRANMGLTGTISPQLGSIANLRDLRLNDCNLTGEIPSELGNLTNLRFLFLQANQLKGQIPPELGDITNLQVLSLWHNQLSGEIPPELGSLSNLQELWLHDNVLTGEIPSELARLDNLELLYLKYNRLTGAIPPQFGNLTNLRELWLHNNGLVSDGLSGEIPPELGNLANLQELLLHDNVLTGEIPPELGNLANLQELSLGGNHLTGAIPVELSRLSKLKSLSLGGNQLTGKIPSQLGDIETLEFISLWQNNLTGEIPPELGKVTNLGGLDLQYNQLTGNVPAEIGNLVNLWSTLDLRGNQLTGRLPHSLTNINDLFNFNFDANAGLCAPADATFQAWLQSIPQHEGPNCEDATPDPTPDDPISPIPSGCTMQTFNGTSVDDSWTSDCVSRNRTENGTHYAKFFSFSVSRSATYDLTLESPTDPYLSLLSESGDIIDEDDDDDDGVFDLRARSSGIRIPLDPGNYIVEATTYAGTATGDFTLTIIRPELAALHALYNATDGANWTNSDNWLSAAPLSDWHAVTTDDSGRVTELSLSFNELAGRIPPELGNLTTLKELSLHNNNLTGTIPLEITNLHNLHELILNRNQLSGEISPQLALLNNLKVLHLGDNQLTGTIPPGFGNFEQLEKLTLGRNNLTGTIPPELSELSNLVALWLYGNELTGTIPPELGNLNNTVLLDFTDNQLTGAIPSELANLTRLEELSLGGNQLTGQIPTWLGDLEYLEELYLHDNQLTGTIPPELGNLTELEELSLSGNQLTGCVPESLEDALEDFDELGLPLCDDTDPEPTLPTCVAPLPDDMTIDGTWNTDCTSNISAPQGSGDRYARFYAFTLSAESDVTIDLSSTADTYLYLRTGTSTDDSPIHENDDIDSANGNYNSRIEETLAPNTYTIEATTYAAGTTGPFTLGVKIEVRPPTTDCTDYSEAPGLAERVASGELPSVCDRLPAEPVVIPVLGDTGEYGGIVRRFYLGPADGCNFFRLSRTSLVRFSQDGFSLNPSIARDWEMSDDGKEWTFYLREGMKWSDGMPFTANDFVWQYENVISNEELNPTPPRFLRIGSEVGSISKVDDTTVKFMFPVPNFIFLEVVAQADEACYGNNSWRNVPWAPSHYMQQFHIDFNPDANQLAQDAGFADWTGLFDTKGQINLNPDKPTLAPWKLTNRLGEAVVLSERNPYFWAVDESGNQLPYLDGIQMTHVEGGTDLGTLKALQGEIDMQGRHIQLHQLPVLKEGEAAGGYTVLSWPAFGGADVGLFFNMSLPGPNGDAIRTKELRQALSLAIDREPIREIIFLGLGQIRQSVPGPGHPHYPGDDIANLRTEYDPDAATVLLDQVFPNKDSQGFRMIGDERIVMDITVTDAFGMWPDTAEQVGRAWEAVGIKTNVNSTTRTTHFRRWNANEWGVMVWNEDTAGFTFSSPDKRAPFTIGTFHGPGCAQWLVDPDDENAFPCAQESIDLLEMHKRGIGLPEVERNALGKHIYKTVVEHQYNIGIVGLSPMVQGVVVKKNTLQNVPDTAANDWILRTPNTAFPEQWYFKPATEP